MIEQRSRTRGAFEPVPMSRQVFLLGLLGLTSAAAGCGGGGGGDQGGGGSPQQTAGGTGTQTAGGETGAAPTAVETPITVRGQEANFHGEETVTGKSSVTVDLYDFYFEPTVLVGSPGQEITVNLLNEGEAPHTFTIEAQNIDVVLQPGQEGKTTVVFPESGRQEVVCRFHIPQGMLGLLVTTGQSGE